MEAVITPGTSANFYQTTWRNISEDSNLHVRGYEKLRSYLHSVGLEGNGRGVN
jgi:hypothetical protein